MSTLHPLSLMLVDVAEGVFAVAPRRGVQATHIEMTVPIDIAVNARAELLGELPRFVTRTAFDAPPSRLTIVWSEVPA